MIIAISGATGFIGGYLVKRFNMFANEVIALNRHDEDDVWVSKITRADVIINLAGSPVFKRWNVKNRKVIIDSRINTTRRIVRILNNLPDSVNRKLLISASAVGIYPDDKIIQYDELSHEKGSGFLAEVVSRWEAEADNLVNPSVRLVIARLGVVIGKNGGFLKPLFPIFKAGLGGVLGTGKQLTCFIHIDDVYKAFLFFIKNENTSGLYNLVTPNPVTNKEFTQVFSKLLHRPAFFKVPGLFLRVIYGEASIIMLNGANVFPGQLLKQGFIFTYPHLSEALNEVIG